jgi:hypothetical protein
MTTDVALERFLMSHLMYFKRCLRFVYPAAGSTFKDFYCHVLPHMGSQLIFALEQETAMIALQEL